MPCDEGVTPSRLSRVWLAGTVAIACAAPAADQPVPSFPELRSLAPTFAAPLFFVPSDLRRLADTVRLTDHRGQVVLVNFWSTTCAPCKAKQPILNALAERYAGSGVVVLGVLLSDDDPAVASRWLRATGGSTFPMLFDALGDMQRRYLVDAIPQMDLIGPDGRIAGHCLGCNDFEGRFAARIDSMLRSRDVIGRRSGT